MEAFSFLIKLGISVLVIVSLWKLFERAGYPGWFSIIPVYNVYIMIKIANRPGWWWLLYFIPILNIVIAIIVSIDFAKAYGKGTGFGLGIFFLSFIFLPVLAFGEKEESVEENTEKIE